MFAQDFCLPSLLMSPPKIKARLFSPLDVLGGRQPGETAAAALCLSWEQLRDPRHRCAALQPCHPPRANPEIDPGTARVPGRRLKRSVAADPRLCSSRNSQRRDLNWWSHRVRGGTQSKKKQNQIGELAVELFENCSKGPCRCEAPIYVF